MKTSISVIIPVYNVEAYLRQCLDSVICQNKCDIEIICVNDGATDSSSDILKEYENKDARIHVVEQNNMGLSEARNTGIRHAKGEYICFLDSDDMLCDGALMNMYEQAKQEELEILCYDAECIYENEKLRETQYKDFYYQRNQSYGRMTEGRNIFADMMVDNAFCDAAWILLIKREWLLENNIWFWPRLIHEDCLFSFQCFMKAKKVTHTNERYVIYRIRENSIMTSRLGYGSVHGRLVCFHHVLQFMYEENLSEKHQKAVIKFARWLKENAKWIGTLLYEEERRKLEELSMMFQFELELMGVGIKDQIVDFENYKKGFEALLQGAKHIVIYGAGKRGRFLWDYMKKIGVADKMRCFVVSNQEGNPTEIDGVEVKTLESMHNLEKECRIVISIRGNVQKDIKDNLQQYGYRDIILLDDMISFLIRQEMLEG